jgi:murein L,D-transpeptidase YafK
MVYSQAKRVFILEHYFALKMYAAVHDAFSNAYPYKKVLNKTTTHQPVTKYWDTGSVCDRKYVQRQTSLTGEMLRNVEETPVQLL